MKLSSSIKALLVGISGTALQWYDFALFGYFAPIIAKTYFPNDNHLAGVLSTFGVFAVGYLLAPIGSIFFGYIGDRFGRKRALIISILAMAIPTAAISVIPGYTIIGIAAPILITLLRVIQGFVASAEFTGSAIFLVEHAKPEHKAFYGCFTSLAYSFGLILAGLAASLFTASFMPEWGWRLGFAVALVAGILIFYLRMHAQETPDFNSIGRDDNSQSPFRRALKEAPRAMIGVIGIAWLVSVMTFGTYVFSATYLYSYFHFDLSQITLIITIALAVDTILEPFIAIIADKVGHLVVVTIGMMAMLIFSVPIFYLLSSGSISLVAIGLIWMSILIAITYAPLNAYMVALFPKEYRYSGFGVAFHIGISIFGGTTPLFMMWLISYTGSVIAPAWYYMFGTIIGLGALALCESSRYRYKPYRAIMNNLVRAK